MINPKSTSFYTLKCEGDGAQEVAALLVDESICADISSIVFASKNYDSDIESINRLDSMFNHMMQKTNCSADKKEDYNPLYIPIGKLEDVVEVINIDSVKFTGMDGNAFAIKTVSCTNDSTVLQGKVIFNEFEMPSYSEIVTSENKMVFN